jgi:hypothetical protein
MRPFLQVTAYLAMELVLVWGGSTRSTGLAKATPADFLTALPLLANAGQTSQAVCG